MIFHMQKKIGVLVTQNDVILQINVNLLHLLQFEPIFVSIPESGSENDRIIHATNPTHFTSTGLKIKNKN